MPTRDRELIFPHLLNIRDLGGCRTRDGQETRWRSLLRADDLCRLTPGGEQYLFDYRMLCWNGCAVHRNRFTICSPI